MSTHTIYYREDGAKMMRPVLNREEYIRLRNGGEQQAIVAAVRSGNESRKSQLVQMNYSCLPNDDGTLRGSTRMTTTVGMDIDHVAPTDMQPLKERILQKKDELGLRMLELSARAQGYHLVFRRRPELSQEENLKWASDLLGVEYDKGAKDITRVFFTTTGSAGDLLFLDDAVFEIEACRDDETSKFRSIEALKSRAQLGQSPTTHQPAPITPSPRALAAFDETLSVTGLDLATLNRDGVRHNTLKLLLPTLCQMMPQEELLGVLALKMPGYSKEQDCRTLVSNFYEKYVDQNRPMNLKQKEIFLKSLKAENYTADRDATLSEREPTLLCNAEEDERFYYSRLPKMPQGMKDSIDAVGPQLAMPAIVAVAPVIGMLATGVRLDVHGVKNWLNLIAYVAGDFASGKGSVDPLIAAWTSELKALEKMYQQQEDEWRAKKRAAKNKKEQPEEPKLPVRLLTLNNTVANLAERLANTDGKHAFSFTPEADTVAQKWKSSINDFSVMLRQSYDVIADYLLDCALYFFRERIEAAFSSRDYAGSGERTRLGSNDSIYARLDVDFGFDGALQHTISVKGSSVTRNQIHQMLKNWKKQGLIVQTDAGRYRKVAVG